MPCSCSMALPNPPRPAQGDQGFQQLRQAFLPGAAAGEAGGDLGVAQGSGGGSQYGGDGGDLFGEAGGPGELGGWCDALP